MILPILMVVGMHLLLPAALLLSLWRGSVQSRTEWYVKLLALAMFFVWIFFSGRWDWVGYPLRWVWPVLFLAAVFASWKKARRLPAKTPLSKKQKWSIAIYAFLTLVFGTYNLGVLTSHWPADEALEISFPLRSGTYYVAHGGSQVQMNYHSAHPPPAVCPGHCPVEPVGHPRQRAVSEGADPVRDLRRPRVQSLHGKSDRGPRRSARFDPAGNGP